jgi:hypothetical protein
MDRPEQIELLREAFLSAETSLATRSTAIVLSLLLAAAVLWLVRRRALREEYSPLWLAVAAGTLLVCLWPGLLLALTRWIGAWTPSSTIFFFGQLFLVLICLNFAVRLSTVTLRIKNLSQELALLKRQLEQALEDKPRESQPHESVESNSGPG